MIKTAFQNWKTTSAGLTMIAGAVIHLVFTIKASTADANDWTVSIATIIGGVGLIFAGDAGAPPPAGSYTATELAKNTPPTKP